jgi:membrane protease YdiL (CAAX protease family)
MPYRPDCALPARALIAVLLVLVCVLFAQAWATLVLQRLGYASNVAANLPRLVGLPLLFAAAWAIAATAGASPGKLLRRKLAWKPCLLAAAIGVNARIAAWAQITAFGAFGWLDSSDGHPAVPLALGWSCPAPGTLVLAALTWWVLVPLTEEFVHRGLVLDTLARFGPMASITGSATVFALCHAPGAFAWVFAMGLVFGSLYRISGVLFYPVIAHAAYDGMNLFDRVCLRLAWNPATDTVPVWSVGLSAAAVFVACCVVVVFLISCLRAGS